jgi:putative membrane protein
VIGDRRLHERVGQGFWDALVARVSGQLREERHLEGLVAAVKELGATLRTHFPRRPDDRNELGDQLSLGPEG